MGKLSILARKTKSFIGIDNKVKWRFIKTFIYTAIARMVILFLPFNKLRKKMGTKGLESPEKVDKETYKVARDISWIVIQASKYTPWESKCLVQALTAQRLMKENGIPTTVYLGVKKGANNEILAHAWTRCGEYFLTGGINRGEYTVVAKFSSLNN
ncbi:lasso peptide biosynthesis B2 protein [Clostridium sp.]|uniref:lasso peptide biosynthesis B2 protein n=1 Tax=Clostridium sp. TaxID=1506 RepID=UPI003F3226A1